MATWTDPSSVNTGPNDPVTSEFGTAALENAVALAEGAANAPKIATKNQSGAGTTGNLDFTVTNFGGARFYIGVTNTGPSGVNMTINATNGSYGTAQTLFNIGAGTTNLALHGYVDFASGDFFCVGSNAVRTTGTLTRTGSISALRFTGASNLTFAVHLMADGGESVT